ncbi:uncharacterized protein LOC107641724 [Arachis ipaensis]|uniref:uncharacterized protein LOC107641724 n=1 Tax=Arachis ipaensis TaxID=130454 RepID=UPI0007AEF038|nr:uncharacterized protein LOC107641724 [Arachis ipaensis]
MTLSSRSTSRNSLLSSTISTHVVSWRGTPSQSTRSSVRGPVGVETTRLAMMAAGRGCREDCNSAADGTDTCGGPWKGFSTDTWKTGRRAHDSSNSNRNSSMECKRSLVSETLLLISI